MICDFSGLGVPHKYWLDMTALWRSNTPLDCKAIWRGCMLFIIGITVCIANLAKLISASSNLFPWARCLTRLVRSLPVDFWRTSIVRVSVLHPSLVLVCGPVVAVVYLLVRIWGRRSPCRSVIHMVSTYRLDVAHQNLAFRIIVLPLTMTIDLCHPISHCWILIGQICRSRGCRLSQRLRAIDLVCRLWKMRT